MTVTAARSVRRRGTPAGALLTVVAVTGVAVAVAGACGGGEGAVPRGDVEAQAARQLAASTGRPPPDVVCPGDLPAKKGATLACVLTADDNARYRVTIAVTAVDGADVDFDVSVADAPLAAGTP